MPSTRLPTRQPARQYGRFVVSSFLLISSLALLSACGENAPPQQGGMKVPVSVVTVNPASTPVMVDLPGRVEAIKNAQIRARVTGIVEAINFEQGSEVKQGQLLFTIDPAPYVAVRDQAAAQLKNAEANVRSARLLAQRYAKLIKANAVSRQEYDSAVAQAGQAEAAVAAAKAALKAAQIDLGYTKVISPISGRIGESLVTEGALVSAAQATQLATVQQIDQVYVDVNRSTAQLAELRRALASGELRQAGEGAAAVEVLLEDGSVYDHPAKLLFSGISVDPTTGQVRLRTVAENPGHILLPGMYVRVRLSQGVDDKALVVPKQALQRTADGLSSLVVVREGKAASVTVDVGAEVQDGYIITKGLNPGEQVIVEGFQKIRPGAPVQPMPWKAQGVGEATPQGGAQAQGGKPNGQTPPAAPGANQEPKPATAPAGNGKQG
ncbi:efflux RND transporter periplasmic adaptor subunit [Paracandidimonas lactea]|uniref:efflux RND transporter periplasmic adaptor subunit n=1 Tax=Paracandidimonas lactea TaxID=2895524 RepID=UPI001F008608|nr:efflux RND transporter periplasmic adaptor subunit [Paracandidimonas lactea]